MTRNRGIRLLCSAPALAIALVACGAPAPTESPPSPTPTLTEIGDGTALESEWRYAVGMDDDAWCTRLQVGEASSSRCGDLMPAGEDAFGDIGHGPDGYTDAQVVEGIVTRETATVWLIGDDGAYRIPAVLMQLDEVGVEGAQAYVGFAQAEVDLTHLMAVKFNGDVLETRELP